MAQKVGVSEATVSRVLNGKPGVSDATREAVLTALDVLGYERPTKLRGERARLVGLVLPELQNPIFPAFAEVVGGALAQQGYTPVLCTQTAGGVTEADYVELLLQQQVSGVVFAGGLYARPTRRTSTTSGCAERKLPDRAGQRRDRRPRLPDGSSCDDAVAVEQAMGHLALARAHAGSGCCSGRPTTCPPSASSRAAQAMAASGSASPLDADQVVRCAVLARGGQAAAAGCSRAGVTGIVCASDPLALGAIRAARRAGLARARPTSRSSASTTRRS